MVEKKEFQDLKSRVRSDLRAASKIENHWSEVAERTMVDHNLRHDGSINEYKAAESFVLQDADGVEEAGRIVPVVQTLKKLKNTLDSTTPKKMSEETFCEILETVEDCESDIDDLAA
ncbi:hypothetical protein IT893_00175 [Thalassospira sp. A40-3]|uniref:hypothetical protein n=1 Tax=Thalassospira sp. A40-3 TaxID=2785908 RepID=UPI0018CFC609|nr:hypothetical protein [Thalassospira sp. A40-3]QPO11991.1 hypothetical protein IT893_00175 [Thalassospira sp. A40-3]